MKCVLPFHHVHAKHAWHLHASSQILHHGSPRAPSFDLASGHLQAKPKCLLGRNDDHCLQNWHHVCQPNVDEVFEIACSARRLLGNLLLSPAFRSPSSCSFTVAVVTFDCDKETSATRSKRVALTHNRAPKADLKSVTSDCSKREPSGLEGIGAGFILSTKSSWSMV